MAILAGTGPPQTTERERRIWHSAWLQISSSTHILAVATSLAIQWLVVQQHLLDVCFEFR